MITRQVEGHNSPNCICKFTDRILEHMLINNKNKQKGETISKKHLQSKKAKICLLKKKRKRIGVRPLVREYKRLL